MNRIQARKKLLLQVKRQVEHKLGPTPPSIRAYAAPFEREAKRPFKVSDKPELLRGIAESSIVYGSDFHAFAQAQRTHLKILRALPKSSHRPIIIGLEALPSGHEKEIAAFLCGRLSEAVFLRKVRWNDNWGFPWENYRPLFDLARDRDFQIVGLNKEAPENSTNATDLKVRDRHSAQIIARLHKTQSTALIYVIFGELHLADPHLPKDVRKKLGRKIPTLKIFLNCETIYFALARRARENTVDVVRLPKKTFCVLSSPPWVQWQTYLMFLDHSVDQDLDSQGDGEEADYTDRVSAMIQVLAQDLGLRFKTDDLAVYSSNDEKIWAAIEDSLERAETRSAENLIAEGKSFFLPKLGVVYLGRAAVNAAAEMAGQYIHSKLSHRRVTFGKMPSDFERLIWIKAVGYFLSKLINPKRQAKTLSDLRSELADTSNAKDWQKILALALDQRMTEIIWAFEKRRRISRRMTRRTASYDQAARILGDMMGERLYLAFSSRKIKREKLMRLLRFPVDDSKFDSFYRSLVAELEPVSRAMKNKKERL